MSASGTIQPKRKSRQNVLSTRPENSTLCLLELLDERAVVDPGDAGGREGGDGLVGADEAAHLVPGAGLLGGERAGLERAADLAVRDGDPLDLALAHQRQELAHRDLDRPRRQEPALDDGQHEDGDEQIDQRELRLLFHGEFHRGALETMLAEAPGPVKLRRAGAAAAGGYEQTLPFSIS